MGIQILDKNLRIPVLQGDKQLAEICFNPADEGTFHRLAGIIADLEQAAASLKDAPEKDILKASFAAWQAALDGLDGIFGKGVCAAFTQGQMDAALLQPLFDEVLPHFEKERAAKLAAYQREPADP